MVFIKTIDNMYKKFIGLPLLFKLSFFFLVFLTFKIIMDNNSINCNVIEGLTNADADQVRDIIEEYQKKPMVCDGITGLENDPVESNIVVDDSQAAKSKEEYWAYLITFLIVLGVIIVGVGAYYLANFVFNKIEE
jgi:hypothetical protein